VSGRKNPVFGIISLALMLSLVLIGVLITVYRPPIASNGSDESLAVVIENAANVIATLLAIAAVSLSSIILAGVSLVRREPWQPAAVSLCLSISALIIVVIAVTKI
jgi:hypothetical protein